MKSNNSLCRAVKAPRLLAALSGLALAVSPAAQASLIVYEGFNYIGQADNAALNAAAFAGGTGLSGNWQGAGKYRSAGLTFSDLAVAGGCAENVNSEIYYRQLSVSKTGTLWGSFLFKSVGTVDTTTTLLSYVVNSQAGGNDWQSTTKFGVTPKKYQGTTSDIRLGGTGTNPTAFGNVGGTAVTQGTTYLVLFKVENLIATGGATASQTITSWILSAAQYDNFKSGGLTEAELNAASQGGAATNVMQKTTLTATQKATFSVSDFLCIQSNNTGDFMNDEFRFSDAGLSEVAPAGTPSADFYTFGPGATIGPVAANAAAISWTVSFGSNVAALAPTYTLSPGATCNQASGSTQNFTSPVHYIVQASDFATSGKTTDYTVSVTVAPDESTLIWNVAGSGAWDLSTTNWKGQTSGVLMPFFNGKNVIFDKTNGGAITIASGIAPASTTISAASGTYAFNGALGGTGGLTKSNGGTLNLDGANTYSGGTIISGGVVSCSLQNPSPLGAAGSNVTVQSGGVLAMNRNQITGNLTLNGGKIAVGNGWGDDAWNGPVVMAATSTVDVGNTDGCFTINGVVSGPGGLIKLGATGKPMPLNGVNTFAGNLTISQGAIALGAAGSIDNVALVSIAAGATFDVSAKSAYSFTGSNHLSASGTATAAKLKGAVAGTISLGSQSVTLTYNGLNPALTVSQGTLVLNGNPFIVNAASALAVGSYNIVTQTTGSITSSGSFPGVTGTAIGAGKVGAISVSGSNVMLTISVPTLEVSAFPSSQTAGVSGTVTVTAKNSGGTTATGYVGTIHFTSTDAAAGLPANYTFVPEDNGVHTFTGVTLKTVAGGLKSITATDITTSNSGTQSDITVTPATASTFTMSGFPASTTAGAEAFVTITAKDAYHNVATDYVGTIQVTSTDAAAILPANYTFLPGDNGIYFTALILNTVSGPSVAITATDTVTATITGTQSGIIVLPATSAATLVVTGFPSPQTAGTPGDVTVTAKRGNGTTATDYTGTIHFTSTDAAATLPENYTFAPEDNGVHTFTSGFTLITAAGGPKSITATDITTAITGTQSDITVTPAPAATLTITGYPSPQFVGTVGSLTVTAKDAYQNVATGYTGTVSFTSTDALATLPTAYTFATGDNGVFAFSDAVTFTTAGTQSITATDMVTPTITGTQSGITVNLVPSSFTWTNAAGGFWDGSTNWTNNAGITYVPDFIGKANYALNFNQAGAYSTTHNLANGFLLNQLNFGGSAVTLAGLNLTLTNDGAILPQINQNSSTGISVTNNLVLAADTTLAGTGNGSVTLNGLVSGAGQLTKTSSGQLVINVLANTYAGGTIINAGTILLNAHTTAPFGTGPITLNNVTLDFNAASISNSMTLNNATLVSGNGFAGNFSGAITLIGNNILDTLATGNNAITGNISGTGGLTKRGATGWPLSGTNTFTGDITISAGSLTIAGSGYLGGGNYSGNIMNNAKFVYQSTASQTLSGVISGSGNLEKSGAGSLILSGANNYTGNTIVNAGTLELLATTGQLKFALGATSGVCNSISGAGAVILDGKFVIDTAAAAALTSGTWTLENVTSLTGVYGPNFSVVGFAPHANGDTWTKTEPSKTWTFVESTGVLTLAAGSDYTTWAGIYPGVDLTNPAADLDGDGMTNQQEYAFGLNPTTGSSVSPITPLIGTQFTYTRRASSGLIYTVEYSADLTTWNLATTSEIAGAANSEGVQSVAVTITNEPVNGKLFVRVLAAPAP